MNPSEPNSKEHNRFLQEHTAEGQRTSNPNGAVLAEIQTKSAAELSRAEMAAQESGAVVVDIYDQIYQLRGTDPAHIEHLAAAVDAKMRAVSAHGATVDSLRVAVLAALNIADELMTLRARYDALAGSLNLEDFPLPKLLFSSISGMELRFPFDFSCVLFPNARMMLPRRSRRDECVTVA